MKVERRQWSEGDIESEIKNIVVSLDIDRMPTYEEIERFCGNAGLANQVCKKGGIYSWAKRLGLEVKRSETRLGYETEMMVMNILEGKGFQCEMTCTRHPYDLLVSGCVKIDVKSARTSKANGSDCYSFGLAKRHQTCDIYVAVCLNDDKTARKIYVIPAHIMTGKTQLALGVGHSKYDEYIDRWEIIDQLSKAFERIS